MVTRLWGRLALPALLMVGWPVSRVLAAEPGSATPPAAGRTLVVAQRQPKADDGNAGTPEAPFRSISRAAKEVQPGDTVLIEEGVYRETVEITAGGAPGRPIRFAAAPLANVTVTGADPITDWKREEGAESIYCTAWPHEYLGWTKRRAHPDDDYHLVVGHAEQVHVDNYPLLQVLSREKLSRGTFCVDLAAKRLYVCDGAGQDPAKARLNVEASVRPRLWHCKAGNVHVRGIRFRYAANHAQQGAVTVDGDHNVMEDCVVERMNGSGAIFLGQDVVVRRCVFRDNGWSGFDVTARDFLMTGCLCEDNNVKNWNRGWGAVNKLVLCRNAVIEKSVFRGNRGNGIWFDIGNEECTVRHCLIVDNEDAGIFYEISYGLHAHDNVILGNGLAPRVGAWGAQAGISLSSSPRCRIERNLLVGNKEGINFREQERTTNRIGEDGKRQYAVWNHDSTIRSNVVAGNRDAQVAGWFATGDARHWPRALQARMLGKQPAPRSAPAAVTDVDRLAAVPAGLSLEDLRLDLAGNLYCVKPGQLLYQWGCLWDPHETYAALEQVHNALGLESRSRVAPVEFADWSALDLRVPANSPALAMQCYPRGEVPGVRLGVNEVNGAMGQ